MIRALIFDLDGTLLDTLQDLADAANEAVLAVGGTAHPVEAYARMIGEGMRALVRRALPAPLRTDDLIARAGDIMWREYSRTWSRHTRPYPGIEAMLDALGARAVPMAILSNKLDELTRQMAARYLGRWQFATVRGARPDVPRKPDPTAALAIASLLEVRPAEVAFVGDSGIDVQTAVAASMIPVGVLWGFRGEEELRAHGARILAGTPADVAALVTGGPLRA